MKKESVQQSAGKRTEVPLMHAPHIQEIDQILWGRRCVHCPGSGVTIEIAFSYRPDSTQHWTFYFMKAEARIK